MGLTKVCWNAKSYSLLYSIRTDAGSSRAPREEQSLVITAFTTQSFYYPIQSVHHHDTVFFNNLGNGHGIFLYTKTTKRYPRFLSIGIEHSIMNYALVFLSFLLDYFGDHFKI